MSNGTKMWKDMNIDELADDVTRELHDALLMRGAKGLRATLRMLLVDIAHNTKDYQKSWTPKTS